MFDIAELHLWKLGRREISGCVLERPDLAPAFYRNEIDVMQFTGLKDKNGNELYSGDIVRDERGEVGVLDDVEYGTWFMWLHEYDDFRQGMQIVIAEPTSHMQTAGFLRNTEIIGNIYENPELVG